VDAPSTLVEALSRLPRGSTRGCRFITADGAERFFSYEAMEHEARRRGALLASLGIAKGERVALVIPEGHEFVLSFLGVVAAGAVPVPIFPRATFKVGSDYLDSVVHIAEASSAKLLLVMESNRALVEPARERVASLARVGTIETLFAPELSALSFSPPALTPDDLCFLQFTSGSTARPKGVMISHGNLIANASAFLGPHGLDRRPDDVGVSWLPLYHDMGLIGFILGPLIVDIPVVILPTATFARGPRVWLETISKYRGTITYAPNFAYALAVKRLKAKDVAHLDLSCLRVAGCGAEPIHAQTLRNFASALAPAGFRPSALLPSYGMAESTLAITFHALGSPMRVDRIDPVALSAGEAQPSAAAEALEVVSCGRPFPGHQLEIQDDAGGPLPERRVGEVVVRGPSVARGYYDNSEASQDSFGPDGSLRTGDLGYLADGNLHICGRKKDLVIIRGANFHPQDIEWALGELPGVRRGNVVAFSVPVEGEERLVLAVECASSDSVAVCARVTTRVNESLGLSPYEVVPVAIGSLPKTSSGKIQRSKTRGLYLAVSLDRLDRSDRP
jgi:fatty-acyl-CoA synthase